MKTSNATMASTTRTVVRFTVSAAVTRFMTCIYPKGDTMKLDLAQAIPPALPSSAAPYGTLLCTRQKCRAIAARKQAAGGLPTCASCGAPTQVHPECQKPVRAKRAAPEPMAMGDASILGERRFLRLSPVAYWDPDNECPHGYLPHQGCRECGRAESMSGYPGIQAVVELERAA